MKDTTWVWAIPLSLFFIMSFGSMMWVNSPEEFDFNINMDNNTVDAIKSLSEYNNSLIINNYDGQYSCVKGCELMHEAVVTYDGAAGQQGKDGKYYYASDCINMCENIQVME